MDDIGEDQDFESTVREQVFEKVNKYIVRKMLSFFLIILYYDECNFHRNI
jgi:hypothetical protein